MNRPEIKKFPPVNQVPLPLLWLMATACGVSVANIYYNQPLLGDFSLYFHVVAWKAGLIAMAAQVGYGLGLLLFVPLGDLVERRRLIFILINSCALCLVAAALAPTLWFLGVAQLLIGMSAVSGQIIIPLAADMVSPAERGKLVGALMSGLLCGLLLGRVVSGLVADILGWRAIFGAAAIAMVILGWSLLLRLPHRPAIGKMSYGQLMLSMLHLLQAQPALRNASMVSGLSFAGFSAFWTTLSFLMAAHFHMGASEAGLFGVIGLIGAIGSPWAGKLADKRGHGFTIGMSLLISAASFVLMGAWVTWASLIIGVLLMDVGVQALQVAAQARVISLVPEARSRLNTVYMVGRFGGGAIGSFLGAWAWSIAAWPGVCILCLALTLAALAVHYAGCVKHGRVKQ